MKWLRKLVGQPPPWTLPSDPGMPQMPPFTPPVDLESFQRVFNELKLQGTMRNVLPGPVVSIYHAWLEDGAKSKQFANAVEDLKIHLGVDGVRYMGGLSSGIVGFEVANQQRSPVPLERFLNSEMFSLSRALPIALARPDGSQYTFDLADAPHMIVAGATGSGKSVLLNTILSGWMYTRAPSQVQLLLIDPKRTEFLRFAKSPHVDKLYTSPHESVAALEGLVKMMECRYDAIASKSLSNYKEWNKVCLPRDRMVPYVGVIDEFADLYLSDPKGVGDAVIRLAQKARAAGIHLIIATQRPSADVFPGLIKANFPLRIALRVSSRVNSQVIIDEPGAENLLGMGDCLLQDGSTTTRLHGPWIDNAHIEKLVQHWADQ